MTQTILIVDDRPDDLVLTRLALAAFETAARIECASGGEEALAFLNTAPEPPAVILLDLKMPGMNGIDTLRKIRADSRFKDIPVMIVTSSTLESDIQASRQAGATEYIHKAIRLDDFSADLARHLNHFIKS